MRLCSENRVISIEIMMMMMGTVFGGHTIKVYIYVNISL